ncbi:hypothetical protein KMZ29_20050 [Bradyrhizobium sediminis]|uniref:Uncharacterized protein n=1 Tax=Bradyrhizobium sediminis TaxID=2840469 RepID=A0A975RLR9_9BRAD|nr:hypothetical protein [Bradyrhizobium sediminis]QWG11999.1 hypothetical protein KMZ29_20050 [Bradyrhizobium sediminis]
MLKNLTLLAAAASIGAALIAPTAASARMGGFSGHSLSTANHIGSTTVRAARIDAPRIEVHPRITPSPPVKKLLYCKITKGSQPHNGCTPWNS